MNLWRQREPSYSFLLCTRRREEGRKGGESKYTEKGNGEQEQARQSVSPPGLIKTSLEQLGGRELDQNKKVSLLI